MKQYQTDVCIIGAGSGGIGAAVGAAQRGAETLVIDRSGLPGGVVASCWVHNWEPTCGNGPLSRRLWKRMRLMPLGAVDMEFTTSRNRPDDKRRPTMPFELWAYQQAVLMEFASFENLHFMGGNTFIRAMTDGRNVISVIVENESQVSEIRAKVFIDATGTLHLARNCGCASMLGADSRYDFNESVAPQKADRNSLNKVNWIYRVRPGGNPKVTAVPDDISEESQRSNIFRAIMPNGDILVNICGVGNYSPEIPGDYERVVREQYKVALDNYTWRVATGLNPDWELVGMAPALGIRESYRMKARVVISFNDAIHFGRKYEKQFVAMTDHPLDVHGTNLEARFGSIPFGIPYESLLPQEFDNLFVASRGIGATHIVTGACRLSRTVMTYGEAAGRAAAICALSGRLPGNIETSEIAEFESCPEHVMKNATERLSGLGLVENQP